MSDVFGVITPLGEKIDFLFPCDLTFKDTLITKSPKSASAQSEL